MLEGLLLALCSGVDPDLQDPSDPARNPASFPIASERETKQVEKTKSPVTPILLLAVSNLAYRSFLVDFLSVGWIRARAPVSDGISRQPNPF